MQDLLIKSDAVISDCGRYRYRLSRIWDHSLPLCVFIMLNPSTADAEQDDATIRRCRGFALREGFGGLVVVNLFAFRATDPKDLRSASDPVGPANDRYIIEATRDVDVRVIAAWGVNGGLLDRDNAVQRMTGPDLMCLGRTSRGAPRHPLYVKATQPLEPYQ